MLVVKTRGVTQYEHIAVATDFSDSALHALDATLRAFPRANVTLFHGFEPPLETIARMTDWTEQTIALQTLAAAPFLAKSQAAAAHKSALRIAIEPGAPEILLPARGAELIVVASHGRGARFERPLGSSARRILEHVPADVLIVRDPRAKIRLAESAGAPLHRLWRALCAPLPAARGAAPPRAQLGPGAFHKAEGSPLACQDHRPACDPAPPVLTILAGAR